MYALDTFHKVACKLSNSLVIKFNLLILQMELGADQMNPEVKISDVSPHDPRLRFYRHIRGEKYLGMTYGTYRTKPDRDVMIKVIENEEIVPLTKEVIRNYTLTRLELFKQEAYYENLVNEYPEMRMYIHGCMWPVKDLDKALEAPDGTILSYNHSFVEKQEYDLIKELEEYIKNVCNRWNLETYTIVDEYYLLSFLAVLFSQLPTKIMALRSSKLYTNQAHSFFLEAYFRSRFDLWDSVLKLKEETKWWLYNNLDNIIKNIGKNGTLESISTNIYVPNYVGLGAYRLTSSDNKLTDEVFTYNKVPFKRPDSIIEKISLNSYYNIPRINVIPVEEVYEEQLSLTNTKNRDEKNHIIKNDKDLINERTIGKLDTKTLLLSTLREFKGSRVDSMKVIMDYWAYMLDQGFFGSFTDEENETIRREFIDPNTGIKYSLTTQTGFYFVLKCMLYALKMVDKPLKRYIVTTVFNSELDLNVIFKNILFDDGLTIQFKDQLIERFPRMFDRFGSILIVGEFLQSVIDYYKDLWILSCNAESSFVSANFKNFLYITTLHKECNIHKYDEEKTIDELLEDYKIDFQIFGDYDPTKTIKELARVLLNIEITKETSLDGLIVAYKDIINKLTSYTTQVLQGKDDSADSFFFYNSMNFIRMKVGLLRLEKQFLNGWPLNKWDGDSIFIAHDPEEDIFAYKLDPLPVHHYFNYDQVKGVLTLVKEGITHYTNTASVDLLPLPSRRLNEVDITDPDMIKPTIKLNTTFYYAKDDKFRLLLKAHLPDFIEDLKNLDGAHTGISVANEFKLTNEEELRETLYIRNVLNSNNPSLSVIETIPEDDDE